MKHNKSVCQDTVSRARNRFSLPLLIPSLIASVHHFKFESLWSAPAAAPSSIPLVWYGLSSAGAGALRGESPLRSGRRRKKNTHALEGRIEIHVTSDFTLPYKVLRGADARPDGGSNFYMLPQG